MRGSLALAPFSYSAGTSSSSSTIDVASFRSLGVGIYALGAYVVKYAWHIRYRTYARKEQALKAHLDGQCGNLATSPMPAK